MARQAILVDYGANYRGFPPGRAHSHFSPSKACRKGRALVREPDRW